MSKKNFSRSLCGILCLAYGWAAYANEASCTLTNDSDNCSIGHLSVNILCKYTADHNCTQSFKVAPTSDSRSEIDVTATETLELFRISCDFGNGHWENLPRDAISSGTIGDCVGGIAKENIG